MDTLLRARLTKRLHAAAMRLDLLDLTPLVPVARWGLSIVWVIAGAATIAAAAILDASILADYWVPIVTIYIAMTVIAIGLFFSAMWPSHTLIVRLKQHQLADIAQHLVQARVKAAGRSRRRAASRGRSRRMGILERRMREVPSAALAHLARAHPAQLAAVVMVYSFNMLNESQPLPGAVRTSGSRRALRRR